MSTYGHKTLWNLWADLWNGDLTFAEKMLTPLTHAHMVEVGWQRERSDGEICVTYFKLFFCTLCSQKSTNLVNYMCLASPLRESCISLNPVSF